MSPLPLLLRLLLCVCLVLNGPATLAAAPMPHGHDAMPARPHASASVTDDAGCAQAATPMAVPHATHDAMRHAAAPMASHDCCDHGRPSHPGGDRCPHPCHAVGASAAVLPALPTLAALRPLPARFASVHAAPASLPHVPLHRPPISPA
jgi:hypothetical protein